MACPRALCALAALLAAIAASTCYATSSDSATLGAAREAEFLAAIGEDTEAAYPDQDDSFAAAERVTGIRAFWADAFSVGFKSHAQITDMVNRAVAGRYNTIIVEVLAYQDRGASGHGAYWTSAYVPRAADINASLADPLATVVSQAHAAGLDVYAWIVPFRATRVWPPAGNAILSARPEWCMVPKANMGGGVALIDRDYYLDPGSPDVQEYLVNIVKELITNYQIDGINLDYIRYVQTDAGYPASNAYERSSLARFRALTLYTGTPEPSETGWSDFRRRTIDEFVRRLRAEIPSVTSNPRQPLRFTADLICFGNAPSNFNSSDAYALFQNWRSWMQQGWLDAGIPMNYKREWNGSEGTWYRNWVNAALGWRYNRHMICGQAAYLNPKASSAAQLNYCISVGADGVCTYSYDATADENMNDVPETDWTWYTYVANNVFTSAATPPNMPWRDPATAVEGTLWGRVTDPSTGLPLDGARIQVGTLNPVDTDGNGYYVVTMVPAAGAGTSYRVTANKFGCSGVIFNNELVYPGTVRRFDITMCASGPAAGDMNHDGVVDMNDFSYFRFCFKGPNYTYPGGNFCLDGDADGNNTVDLRDFFVFQEVFGQ